MENSRDNRSSSTSSNFQLFTVNGAPLKFNLFGYSLNKFREMVKIIEDHGGELSMPDDPGTFVFSERNCPVGAGESNRYDFQYILDSMDALQPLPILNYKLQIPTDEQASRPHLNNLQKASNYSADEQNELSDTGNSCTSERVTEVCSHKSKSSTDVDRLKKNESKVASHHHRNSHDFIEIVQAQCAIPPVDNENFDIPIVSRSTEDSESIRVASNHQSTARKRRPHRIMRVQKKFKDARHEKIIFTEEECLKMIKWFKENKLLPAYAGMGIWKRMLRETVLPNRNCSHETLKVYFRKNLQKAFESGGPILQPQYSGKRAYSEVWPDEEKQVIIKYLIDNDAIHRAGKLEVMKDCWEVNKSLLHPTRTAQSLLSLFYRRLRYEYPKLTDDKVALEKFKRL